MLAVFLAFMAQPLDPVEQYERRFEQKTTPPALYIPQPRTNPPVIFNQPFGSSVTLPKPDRRYIDQNGKLVTCRNTGPWVYCF